MQGLLIGFFVKTENPGADCYLQISAWSLLIWETSFPSFPSAACPRQNIIPQDRRPAIPSTTFCGSLFLATSLLLTPDLEGFTASTWPGCLQAFLWPPCLLAPGLLASGRLAAIHPRRSSPGSVCRSLQRIVKHVSWFREDVFSTILSEVKLSHLQWEQGLVLVYKKRHPKNPEQNLPMLNNSKKTSL